MNGFLKSMVVGFLLVFLSLAIAKTKTPPLATLPSFPAELTFKNQALDPLCFNQYSNDIDFVALNNCGHKLQDEVTKTGYNKKWIKAGFIGYNFTKNGSKEAIPQYSYYKIITGKDNSYILYTIDRSEKYGQFSAIKWVTRKGNKLVIKVLRGGDRCNGGIDIVRVKDQSIIYSVNITPFEFLRIAHFNPMQLRPDEDLGDCATCCVAKAFYHRDLQNIRTEYFDYVDLANNDVELTGSKYQNCFNEALNKARQRKDKQLDFIELKAFLAEFNSKCVR